MGWNVKHPTKWVSYRSLHETFWVSLALEGWLKWFCGFSIFFGWKVRGSVGLPGAGSKMVFWGCRCHSWVMPWVSVREIILQGSQRNLGQTALARGGPIESEPLGATESPQEKEGCAEGVTCVRASEKILNPGWWCQTADGKNNSLPGSQRRKPLQSNIFSLLYM